ncbi:MAG: hypothetical protein QOC57_1367 [Ilumatobacteraceae bacterium]|jgi:hypothetical protein
MNMSGDRLVAEDRTPGASRMHSWRAPAEHDQAGGPLAWATDHQALRNLEHHVLEQWRRALESGDTARVGRLVELGHAVREALHRTELSPEDEPSAEPTRLRLVSLPPARESADDPVSVGAFRQPPR